MKFRLPLHTKTYTPWDWGLHETLRFLFGYPIPNTHVRIPLLLNSEKEVNLHTPPVFPYQETGECEYLRAIPYHTHGRHLTIFRLPSRTNSDIYTFLPPRGIARHDSNFDNFVNSDTMKIAPFLSPRHQ